MVTMLAEYGFPACPLLQQHGSGNSPWGKLDETVFETDPRLPGLDDIQVEIQIDGSFDINGNLNEEVPQETPILFADDDNCSLGTSHMSSEFDDEVSRTDNAEDGTVMFDSDFLTNCFINDLPNICIEDNAVPDRFENLSFLEIPVANSIEVVSDDGSNETTSSQSSGSSKVNSPSLPRKRRRDVDSIPWSELSYNERQTLLEDISIKVSDVLGPREQLELLRIIDPDIQSLPQDGQFTIQPDFLDNEKLERIKKLIERNIISSQTLSTESGRHCSLKQTQRRDDSPKQTQKKKQSKERRNQLKALRQRRRKEYKQNVKEKRSGLFRKEEVLALQSFAEDDEVDILE